MKLKILAVLTMLFVSAHALAAGMSLDDAKKRGLVGETPAGYLAMVTENISNQDTATVAKLIAEINKKRKAKYQELADANKITLAQVEQLAGKKAIQKTQAGLYVQFNGQWVKK